ncbi:MAG: ester cyclase [Planctomycetes bacterium]|nr:ester cyclase [Planctomycetota bacterium]
MHIPRTLSCGAAAFLLAIDFGLESRAQGAPDHEALIRGFVDMFNDNDMEIADRILGENVVRFHPRDEVIRSRDDFKAFVRSCHEQFEGFHVEAGEIVATRTGGFLTWTVTGKHTGTLDGPATNKTFALAGSDNFVIVGGKIVHDVAGWNAVEFYRQLGVDPCPPPKAYRNLLTLRRVPLEVHNEQSMAVAREIFAANHEFVENGRQYRGIEGFQRRCEPLFAAFPDLRLEVSDEIAEGDRCSHRWVATGTHSGTFLGIPATEKRVRVEGMCQARFDREGKIVTTIVSWDSAQLLQQLGVMPGARPVGK